MICNNLVWFNLIYIFNVNIKLNAIYQYQDKLLIKLDLSSFRVILLQSLPVSLIYYIFSFMFL